MENVLHNKDWNQGTEQLHVDPPLILLIKSKNDEISDKGCVKIRLLRDLMPQKLDL